MNQRIDGLTFVSMALILFMGFNVLRDRASLGLPRPLANPSGRAGHRPSSGGLVLAGPSLEGAAHASSQPATGSAAQEVAWPGSEADMLEIAAPYEDYTLTQGPHGASYGHMAIDLAAGKGVEVLSPINGIITERYVDEYGNPTLVIENDIYRITLLHGKYTVSIGDRLQMGQPVGHESNLGYTADLQGRPCNGRKKCGYHTHLNIYDKRLQSNVNPLDLIR